jgi:hypothetical protein
VGNIRSHGIIAEGSGINCFVFVQSLASLRARFSSAFFFCSLARLLKF